jgi:hypothetical protein
VPTHELSVNILAHLLSPTTRNVFLLTMASQIIGAKSPLESTLELTTGFVIATSLLVFHIRNRNVGWASFSVRGRRNKK